MHNFIFTLKEMLRHLLMSLNAPDYIYENLAELFGTLLASIILACITTYIFNRRQEINKVKARVMHYRAQMYEDITALLKQYDRQINYQNDRETIEHNLSEVSIPCDGLDMYTAYILCDHQHINEFLKQVEEFCIKGLYILDDDVLQALLSLKIYLMNYCMYSNLARDYISVDGKFLPPDKLDSVNELFFQCMSSLCADDYEKLISALELQVHQKTTSLKFKKPGKNYRKIHRRMKLQDKLWENSTFAQYIPNEMILLGVIICNELKITDESREAEMKHWLEFVQNIMGQH